VVWAVGIDGGLQRLSRWGTSRATHLWFSLRLSPYVLILTLLTLATGHTVYDYFGRWASAAEARYIYGADIAEIADYLSSSDKAGLTAISAEYYRDLDPFRLTVHFQGQPPFVIWFDGRQTLAFPPPGSDLSPRYIFSAFAPPADIWYPFLEHVPAESGQAYAVYHLAAADSLEQAWQTLVLTSESEFSPVNINDDLILANYRILGVVESGGKFQVLLAWQALHSLPPGTDYTFLVRLVDEQGHTWARADGNGYPPANWQPGVRALQLLTVRLPGDLPPQPYQLLLEIVNRQTGQPLPTDTGERSLTLKTELGKVD
jgi:hypothetical protein